MVVIVAVVVVSLRRMGVRTMGIVVMLDLVATRMARMRTEERDEAGHDRAEQRQEDDRLVHARRQPFIRLMSSTAIEPRLRKYTTRIASPIAASAAATVSTTSA